MDASLPQNREARRWPRGLGIAFGLGTQLLFAVTVWFLFWFLHDGVAVRPSVSLEVDSLLSLQFAVVHSLLLWPPVRQRLTRFVPDAFYGCLFCVSTCAGLLLLFGLWQASSHALWELKGVAAVGVRGGYYLSWVALIYSLSLTGLGYQTGWTPWWHWFRQRPLPRRQFEPRGAYRWLRHPVYVAFLGLIWFTPHMTVDHAVLTGLWTVYIFLGSHLKDERLAYYLGDRYRCYQAQVPGYPGMPWSRRRMATASPGVPPADVRRRAA